MQLIRNLYDHFYEKAHQAKVETICVGLRYTAVSTDEGGIGIAYTYGKDGGCCSMNGAYHNYEGESASELLSLIKGSEPLNRSIALALINAMNYHDACRLPEDSTDRGWMDSFGIGRDTRLAMVGFFHPLMKLFENRGALVEALDDFQGIGNRSDFYGKLGSWAEVLLLTSTSILNNSTEEILDRVAPGVKVLMLGPSTPMVAEAFRHLPVQILAGTVPVDKEAVLRAIRHGAGTPVIHRSSRKVTMTVS
ncbi:MAG: Rossmann-like domain-containing protein [Syntrophobacteraceae bacterium]